MEENQKPKSNKTILILIILLVVIIVGLIGYILLNGKKGEESKSANETNTSASKDVDEEKDEDKDKNKEKDTDEDEESDSESDEDDDKNSSSKFGSKKDSKDNDSKANESKENKSSASSSLGEKYVDYDNRSFEINGKVYTLGKTTLQEMIDDGVPFEENDLANANNNLNKNTESQAFSIELGEYYSAQVSVGNYSGENMKIADCTLSEIYLPVKQDQDQDILSFAFPLTITEDELVKNAGEATDKSNYDGGDDYKTVTYKYQKDSEKYIGSSGYTFEFLNGELRYVTINYKP